MRKTKPPRPKATKATKEIMKVELVLRVCLRALRVFVAPAMNRNELHRNAPKCTEMHRNAIPRQPVCAKRTQRVSEGHGGAAKPCGSGAAASGASASQG